MGKHTEKALQNKRFLGTEKANELDGLHKVYDCGLRDGGLLHEFRNHAGIPYAAIYRNGREEYSHEIRYEEDMVECWNSKKHA